MARRLIHTNELETPMGSVYKAKVYRDPEWNEYVVEFYSSQFANNGEKGKVGTYHTDDKVDAIATADNHITNVRKQFGA